MIRTPYWVTLAGWKGLTMKRVFKNDFGRGIQFSKYKLLYFIRPSEFLGWVPHFGNFNGSKSLSLWMVFILFIHGKLDDNSNRD